MAQKINVDVTPNLFQQILYYHQGDVGREFEIAIVTKDGYEVPSGATFTIQATKPSGLGFSVSGTASGNVVAFTSTEEMTDEFGRFPAQLKIADGTNTIFTANFLMVGEKNTHPDGTTDGSQETIIPTLTLLVERIEAAAETVDEEVAKVTGMIATATTLPAGSDATANYDSETSTLTFGIPQGEAGAGAAGVTANAYSASKTYAVGDYAIHNSNLYRCTTAITTAESFTENHWTQVVLADDVSDLKSDLSDETSARILLAGRVTTAESDIDTLETHKVAQPLDGNNQPTNGTSGQLLRTRGNGATEWADVGLPTDEQTAQAVNDWLDAHPEATTTVEDASLTFAKFVIGTLGYVTPRMFGAKGDGITVDNVALNECLAFAGGNNIPCHGENLTYLIDNSTASYAGHYGVKVTGGTTIKDFHFKLASGCPDMTTLLACKYDSNPYVIENCTFEGELRTISAGAEDGGNHGIIFCDGTDMFPGDWQDYADVIIRDCSFFNIQSYGVFPTPINNRLIVENCDFSCHGCGILAYATDSVIRDCTYIYLSGSNTTVVTLVIDEIENFASASAIKKNIRIIDCISNRKIYQIQQIAATGAVYGDIRIERCNSYGVLFQTYYSTSGVYPIVADSVLIKDSVAGGATTVDPIIYFGRINCGKMTLDNVVVKSSFVRFLAKGDVEIVNCHINSDIRLIGSILNKLKIVNCLFSGSYSDGFFTTRNGTIATCDAVYIENCITDSASILLYDIDADNIYVNGLIGSADKQVRLFKATDATDTNIYVDGLIMPVANTQWNYFIEGILGKAVIRGMSAGINTLSVAGGVTKEVTTIPAE